jgi:hypothetical protein
MSLNPPTPVPFLNNLCASDFHPWLKIFLLRDLRGFAVDPWLDPRFSAFRPFPVPGRLPTLRFSAGLASAASGLAALGRSMSLNPPTPVLFLNNLCASDFHLWLKIFLLRDLRFDGAHDSTDLAEVGWGTDSHR